MTHEIVEPLAPGLNRTWELTEVYVEQQTPFQRMTIAKTDQGVTLFCDNDRQSSEFSQLLYHEALLIPALLLAGNLRRVLVVGSSEGVVSQLAITAGATHVDHVDIDAECVRLCAQHLPYGYTSAEVAEAEDHAGAIRLHYADGYKFIAETTTQYDVVVIDLPDERTEEVQHNRLYEADFLRMCRRVLAPGGVLVGQAGCPTLWRNETLKRSWRRFHDVFPTVTYFGSDEQEWAFLCGAQEEIADPVKKMLTNLPALPYHPRFIDADVLHASTIPPYSLRHSD